LGVRRALHCPKHATCIRKVWSYWWLVVRWHRAVILEGKIDVVSLSPVQGKTPWTFHMKHKDNEATKKKTECQPIEYPKPDGKLSFDLLTNLARSGTNHNENQPAHLKLRNPSVAIDVNYKGNQPCFPF
jgi:hypothetical protein